MDMHSGGGLKEEWEYIYIELPKDKAEIYFYNRFGHSASRVSCTCCGEDYSLTESETLEEATAFNRGCAWTAKGYIEEGGSSYREYIPLSEYLKDPSALIIYEKDIDPKMTEGYVPEQGYVWQD